MSRVQRVGSPGLPQFGWTVVDDDYVPIEPIDRYLRFLQNVGRSPNTLYAYAHGTRLWWDYLEARGRAWNDAGLLEVLGAWVASLARPSGNVIVLRPPAPARAKSTINLYVTAVYGLYRFHRRHGLRVLDDLIDSVDGRPSRYKSFLAGLATPPSTRRLVDVQRPRRVVKNLALEQCIAVIAAQRRRRDKLLFALMLVTGMRVGQTLGLRHEDFVSRQRVVRIVARTDNANGARSKSTDSDVIGVSPVTAEVVRLYSDYMHEEYGDLDSDYVFVNLWGGQFGRPMSYGAVNDLVRRTREKVGFHFTPHQFRHSFATICREAGVSMDVLSKLLTHKSLATTNDVYFHLDADFVRAELVAAGVLDDTLGSIL